MLKSDSVLISQPRQLLSKLHCHLPFTKEEQREPSVLFPQAVIRRPVALYSEVLLVDFGFTFVVFSTVAPLWFGLFLWDFVVFHSFSL